MKKNDDELFPRVDHLPEIDLPTSEAWRAECHRVIGQIKEKLKKERRPGNVREQLAAAVGCSPGNITQTIGRAPGKKSTAKQPPYETSELVLRISAALGVALPTPAMIMWATMRLQDVGADDDLRDVARLLARLRSLPDDVLEFADTGRPRPGKNGQDTD